jgi:hypothetical protein
LKNKNSGNNQPKKKPLKKSLLKQGQKKVERLKKNKQKKNKFFMIESFTPSMMYIHTFLIDFILTNNERNIKVYIRSQYLNFTLLTSFSLCLSVVCFPYGNPKISKNCDSKSNGLERNWKIGL